MSQVGLATVIGCAATDTAGRARTRVVTVLNVGLYQTGLSCKYCQFVFLSFISLLLDILLCNLLYRIRLFFTGCVIAQWACLPGGARLANAATISNKNTFSMS